MSNPAAKTAVRTYAAAITETTTVRTRHFDQATERCDSVARDGLLLHV